MSRLTIVALCVLLVSTPEFLSAQRVRQLGRSIVEFSSPEVKTVAAYEYSRRNHGGEWLLVEIAVQAKKRIAIERSQITLLTSDEQTIPLASQQEFLDGHTMINGLLQNAKVWRRSLDSYFAVRPEPTIRFFTYPGRNVHDSFVTNPDETAAGDLFFRAAAGSWPSGNYRLVMNHPDAKAELPIQLD
ncbi:MAG TPA: hypothetical protein VFS23_29780 [Vicinamibacterales bacterium]|nr:hypothetical protein [Vicinamibacterales bacterium]